MFFQDVQRGALHGIINPLFEEDVNSSDFVENDLNTDTFSYCYKRSDVSSSECDGSNIDEIAFHDENKVFDKVVIEDQYTPCNDFYNECFNVTNSLAHCEEPLKDSGSDSNIDDIYEYKSSCSCEYNPVMQKDIQCQGMYDPFPHAEYDAFIFEVDSMLDSLNKEGFQF